MSFALYNVAAAYAHAAQYDIYPMRLGNSPFAALENLEILDAAREEFFHDEQSRKIFDWISQYRILRSLFPKGLAELLPNAPYPRPVWEELVRRAQSMPGGYVQDDYLLDRIDTWILEAYSLKGVCEVAPGDCVLDCGAFTGSTAVYFSQKSGPEGRVYAFEPMPGNFAALQRNVEGLANVRPINAAVSNKRELLRFRDKGEKGEGSAQCADGTIPCQAFSIDELAASLRLKRLDFIKMDVEGAEEAALNGAAQSIRAFRPKMAISVYHKEWDVVALPGLIRTILPEYKFALRHFSDCEWESVLYCYLD